MSAPRRWLRFAAGGLEVAAPASAFRRALPAPSPLPERLESAGERTPVIDLGALAGTAAAPPAALLLVLAEGAAQVAVAATEVSGTLHGEPGEVVPLPWPYRDGERAWCAGVLLPAGDAARAALVLDLAGLARSSWRAEAAAVSAGEAAS